MADVSKHSDVSTAAGRPLRRARFAAWSVFLGMAGTTMAFQVFHAVTAGQMPWPLAALYGVVPLAISIGVLAFAAHWPSRWARVGAYTITAGAMYMSASATGIVTIHAAAPHAELLFGLILDGAALLAIRFIFDGPSAAQAVAAVVQREAELTAKADGERSAREQAEVAGRSALADLKARADAELAKRDAAWREEMTAVRAGLERELDDMRTARETTEAALTTARSEAEKAVARVEILTRKLEAADRKRRAGNGGTGSGSRTGNGSRKPEAVPGPDAAKPVPDGVPEAPADLDAESAVLWYVDKGLSASAAGVAAGLSDSRGRQIVRKLTAPAPAGVDPVTDTASGGNAMGTGGGSE